MSWKTTLFGIIGMLGAAITGCYQAGLISPGELPGWVKGVGILLAAIGTGGVGLFARDNNKTSEQVGAAAGKTPANPASVIGLIIIFCALIGCIFALVGCAALQPGADPLVVRAEQTLEVSTNALSTLVNIDDQNREFFRTNAPGLHSLAESLRQRVILPSEPAPVPWGAALIINTWSTKQAYKAARSAGNSNALYLAWTTLNEVVRSAQQEVSIVTSTNFNLWPTAAGH